MERGALASPSLHLTRRHWLPKRNPPITFGVSELRAFTTASMYSNAAIDLNRSMVVLFIDRLTGLLHGRGVMLRIALTAPVLDRRESDCQRSYVRMHLLPSAPWSNLQAIAFVGQELKGFGS